MTESNLILEYYDGAYGPTIRISTPSIDELKKIKHVFEIMALHEVTEINLESRLKVRMIGISSLHLKKDSNETTLTSNLKLISEPSSLSKVVWTNSTIGWHECADLVDGIIESRNPGHAYLTLGSDIIIELSYRE